MAIPSKLIGTQPQSDRRGEAEGAWSRSAAQPQGAPHESRARLDHAAKAAGIGFWYCDLPFDVLNWDEQVKEHFWLPPDAAVTIATFFERIHPDDREPTRRAIDASLQAHSTYECDYRTVDPSTGTVRWIRARGGAVYDADGQPLRFDGVTVDITARKLDEERIARLLAREREQARLLKKVAEAALSIHSCNSLESMLRVVAEEGRTIMGANLALISLDTDENGAQAIVSMSASEPYRRWLLEPTPQYVKHFEQLVNESGRSLRLTRREIEADPAWQVSRDELAAGTVIRGWLSAPLVSRGGRNLGLIQLADKVDGDFTDTDEAILVQFAHIASVAIENVRLYAQVRDQDRRKDEFLAILAHELRNPLAPLRNGLEVMRLTDDGNGRLAQIQAMMDRQLSHMVRLIDDLLDISRISRNKMELRRARVLLSDVVNNTIETVHPLIENAGHDLTISLPSEPVYLYADITRLSQVLANLLSNSAKYTERNGQIWLTAVCEERNLIIKVRDTGIGIPAHAIKSVFDMFSQVDRTLERTTGGMGIGLALVKGLVEMHGGTVEAASPGQGQGSTFTVRLPYLDSGATAMKTSPELGCVSATNPERRILVVDDNRDSATSMALMLKLLGNDVSTASNGEEAVEIAEKFRPSIILMDLGMPLLNGYEATRRIRQQPWGRGMIILALTGWGQDTDRTQSREAGCDGHLVKPVNISDLEKLFPGDVGRSSLS